MTNPVARRYASALSELATEASCFDNVVADLRGMAALLNESPALKTTLTNPGFMRDERKAVLGAVVDKGGLHAISRNFLFLLVDNNRMGVFTEILSSLEALYDEQTGRVRAEVTSASPLDDAALEQLKAHLLSVTGKKEVILETQVDPELIGGIVTRVGDLVFDGSIQTQLRLIRQKLLNQETPAEA